MRSLCTYGDTDAMKREAPDLEPCHEMAILGADGDTRMIWDPDSPIEVETAREAFNRLIKEGYSAFSVTADGERGRRIDTFDPTLKALIMVPRIVGG